MAAELTLTSDPPRHTSADAFDASRHARSLGPVRTTSTPDQVSARFEFVVEDTC